MTASPFAALATILAAGGVDGPDIVAGGIPDVVRFGFAQVSGEDYIAYAFGTVTCNVGVAQAAYAASPSNQHPIAVENLYRIEDGAIEQIGMSWARHGFCALQQAACGNCQPAGGGCAGWLGIGCSTADSASTQGSQSLTGPRSIVDASSATFPGTWTDPTTTDPVVLRERLRVRRDDLDPALHPGAAYFAELHLLHPGDAASGADANNLATREVVIGPWTSTGWTLTFGGAVEQGAAVSVWASREPWVRLVEGTVPGDGRFVIAASARAVQQGSGGPLWRYTYALFNATCDRAFGGVRVLGEPLGVSDLTVHTISHHSGEPYSAEPWLASVDPSGVHFTVAQPHAANPNGNALRWSTMLTCSFDSPRHPVDGPVVLETFVQLPGDPGPAPVTLPVPSEASCAEADLDCDGVIGPVDLAALLGGWGMPGSGDIDRSGLIGAEDLAALLAAWTS